jgi:FkbM family methyltransferase
MKSHALLQILTLRGHTFLPGPLGPSSVVVDLGSNRGEFAQQVRACFGCRVIAVEANPRLFPQVRGVQGVEAFNFAVSGRNGEATFHFSEESEAGAITSGIVRATGEAMKVPTRTLASLLDDAKITHVDLLKVDIEGAEVEVFDSLSDAELGRVDQITLEFHDFCNLVAPAEVKRIADRLRNLGFDGIRFGGWDKRSKNLNWLFVRRGLRRAGWLRRSHVKFLIRPLRDALHRARHLSGWRLGAPAHGTPSAA